ncbi:lipid-A-disaccharide synthase [Roseitranquillus sediminis]|uniref:lipid-A-disaccharide synthase n=1 Tax=Roseitranquillus sediminis TaxID=2809051 RepID=UPI001D0C3A29|nr:lipid-A-disaccharide synthase [Roseitranquillus sediminis]MBM9595632.1 lipid-A-disaccharide synthase [Roseitranquillus sediminis]
MKLFLTAGEPSGDRLGAALLAGLRSIVPDLEVQGVGGPLMAEQGLTSLFPMDDLSVMGIAEILPRYRLLRRRIGETAAAAVQARPDALITIDSPDFSLRVIRKVRSRQKVHTVHYVAPTVWAWRSGRAMRMAPMVDQVLALFPFEPPYLEAEGMRCDFVGHPVVTERQASDSEVAALRARLGPGAPVVLVLPGSRHGEVARLAPIFGATLRRVAERHPNLRVLVPALPQRAAEVAQLASEWPGAPLIVTEREERRAAFKAADVALAKSGTVTLELAAAGTPMVVGYDMTWISRQILKRMLRTDTVTLVNLVSETRAVPEFLGADCRPDLMARALVRLLENPSPQIEALETTMRRLGRGGTEPGLRAARAVLDGLP